MLGNEDEAAFLSLAAALRDELAPAGPLQEELADQIALAIWRARRSNRIETELFNYYLEKDRPSSAAAPDFGLLVIRDRNGARALDTLLRYRGSVQAELFRALAALKALQAEAAASMTAAVAEPAAAGRYDQTNPKPALSLVFRPICCRKMPPPDIARR